MLVHDALGQIPVARQQADRHSPGEGHCAPLSLQLGAIVFGLMVGVVDGGVVCVQSEPVVEGARVGLTDAAPSGG